MEKVYTNDQHKAKDHKKNSKKKTLITGIKNLFINKHKKTKKTMW